MNPDNITPPSSQLPHPPHHVSPTMKMLMLVLGVAMVATLGYFTWYVGGETDMTEEVAPSVKDKTEETATAEETTTDETADWKTYTNATHGFSFKYPADELKEGSISDSNTAVHLEWLNKPRNSNLTKVGDLNYEGIFVNFYDNPNKLSAEALYEKDFPGGNLTSFGKLVDIAGTQGIQTKLGDTGKYLLDIQYIPSGTKYFRIHSFTTLYAGEAGEEKTVQDDDKAIFDQIVASFKFTK